MPFPGNGEPLLITVNGKYSSHGWRSMHQVLSWQLVFVFSAVTEMELTNQLKTLEYVVVKVRVHVSSLGTGLLVA